MSKKLLLLTNVPLLYGPYWFPVAKSNLRGRGRRKKTKDKKIVDKSFKLLAKRREREREKSLIPVRFYPVFDLGS